MCLVCVKFYLNLHSKLQVVTRAPPSGLRLKQLLQSLIPLIIIAATSQTRAHTFVLWVLLYSIAPCVCEGLWGPWGQAHKSITSWHKLIRGGTKTHTKTHKRVHTQSCARANTHTTHNYTHAHTRTHTHTHAHTRTHTHTHTHARTHAHTQQYRVTADLF